MTVKHLLRDDFSVSVIERKKGRKKERKIDQTNPPPTFSSMVNVSLNSKWYQTIFTLINSHRLALSYLLF